MLNGPTSLQGAVEPRIPEAQLPRRTLLGNLRHPDLTRPLARSGALEVALSALDLLVEANLDLLVDALSLYYCHSLGVRKIGEQRQTNGSQRHRDGSVHNPLPIPQEVRRLSCRVHP